MQGEIILNLEGAEVGRIDASVDPQLFMELVRRANARTYAKRKGGASFPEGFSDHHTARRRLRARQDVEAASVRTPAGRAVLDERLLKLMTTEWQRFEQIRPPDVKPAQARASAHRLLASHEIESRGKARATEYRLRKPRR